MKIKIRTIALAILAAATFASCGKQNGENLSPAYSASDAEIWCAPSSVKVLATQSKETYANERTNGVQLSAAKNEYESAQVIVSAKKDLFFTVEAGELTNVADSSKKIGKENCTVYTQKYITVTKNWHKNGAPTGDYPDAILPQENAVKFGVNQVKADRNGGAWLEYYIPENAEAGDYAGSVSVKIGADEVKVPVTLKVYDVTIDEAYSSKSLFTVNAGQVAAHELDSSENMLDKYYDLLLRYKVSPSGMSNNEAEGETRAEKYANKVYEYVKKGMNTVGIPMGGTGTGMCDFSAETVSGYIVALAKKSLETGVNLLETAAFYDWYIDEPFFVKYADGKVAAHIEEFDKAIALAEEALRGEDGYASEFGAEVLACVKNVRHVITDYNTDEYGNAHRTKGIIKNADGTLFSYEGKNVNLCPKPDAYNTQAERETYDTGKEKWWYNCNDPSYPYPSYHIDDTMTSAISVGWMMGEYGIAGNLYWAVNIHYVNGENLEDPYQTAHRGSGANGDGAIVYPGKAYDVDGPVASIRLDAIRDGNEDYELISALKAAYAAKGFNATPMIHTLSSAMYSGSSIVGDSKEYEASRELLLSLAESAAASSAFMVTDVKKAEEKDGSTYTIKVAAADGVKLYEGDRLLEKGEDGLYTVRKKLTENKNYFSVRIVESGKADRTFEMYLGGKEEIYAADTFTENDLSGDISSRAFENGYNALTLSKSDGSSAEKYYVNLTHASVGEISARTAEYIFKLYNYSESETKYEIEIDYDDYGVESAATGVLQSGENEICLNFFSAMSWNGKGRIRKIRVIIFNETKIGFGDLRVNCI